MYFHVDKCFAGNCLLFEGGWFSHVAFFCCQYLTSAVVTLCFWDLFPCCPLKTRANLCHHNGCDNREIRRLLEIISAFSFTVLRKCAHT